MLSSAGTRIEDLGPANASMFPLMSGLQVGGTVYIGSRNLAPSRVLAYDLGSRRVAACCPLGPGKFVQALATDSKGGIYAGIVGAGQDEPNLFLIDTTAEPQVRGGWRIPDLYVRALSIAPDGVVYAVGREHRPGLWELRPDSGTIRRVAAPAPDAIQACGVAATATAVFFGAGSDLAGGAGASRSELFRVERATGVARGILPPELAGDPGVSELAVVGDRLFVGTYGLRGVCHLAVLDLDGTALEVFTVRGKFIRNFCADAERVYFGARDICCYDTSAHELLTLRRTGDVERWGLGRYGHELVSVSSMGGVDHFDLDTGDDSYVDLLDAGAPRDLQLGMSLAADARSVYVGGNSGVVEHSLVGESGPSVRRIMIPGEAKSMDVIDGDLYLAVYNSQGLWRYRPGGAPECVSRLPVEQNRPQDTGWDPERALWFVGSQCDTEGGGSLAVYQPRTNALYVHVNPLGRHQMVRAVAVTADACCLGGWSRRPVSDSVGEVACYPTDGLVGEVLPEARWRTDPEPGAGISTLAALDGVILGCTITGTLFGLDARTGGILGRRQIPALTSRVSRMITVGDRVYVQSADTTIAVHADLEYEVLVDGLHGQWYSGPKIAADPHGCLYTLRGRHLVRITPPGVVAQHGRGQV